MTPIHQSNTSLPKTGLYIQILWFFRALLFIFLHISISQAQVINTRVTGNAVEAIFIIIDGDFESGLADRFKEHVETKHSDGYRVVLNSHGGNLIEGIQLGRLIREYKFDTEVGKVDRSNPYAEPREGICLSACALAFLGGVVRAENSAESLGFHRFYSSGTVSSEYLLPPERIHADGFSDAQIISGLIVNYMVEMGVDARVFTAASMSGPNEITILSQDTAIAYNVVQPDGFGKWYLEPYKKGIIAASERSGPIRAHSRVYQSTIFCRTYGETNLMLTADGGWGEIGELYPDLTASINVRQEEGAELVEFTIPPEAVSVRDDGNATRITLNIGERVREAISSAIQWGASVHVARVHGGFFVWHEMKDMDRKMVGSAMRHCF